MRRIVSTSLRFRWLVLFLAAATLALGFVQIPETKVDVFPEFAPPQVEIQTIALGNSSNEVEQLITVPIEDQLNGIEGLADLRSKSVAQLSSIRLIFDRGTDELRARQLVAERLSQITPTLPTWASPPFMMPALSATSRIMKIGLTSESVNLVDMSTIAYWKVRSRLLRVPGVAQVAIWGERLPQRHVQVDPSKLTEYDISLQQVMDTSANALESGLLQYSDGAVVGTGGFVESDGQRLNIRHVQPITGPDQLGEVPVLERDGKMVRLKDLGQTIVDPGPLIGDAVVDDGPGLLLVVQKYRGANTVDVTRGVEEAMAEMAPGLPGIEVDTTIFRPATFIEQSLDNLTRALLLGVLLVTLIIVAFLFEWRTAFISLIAIPLSLVAAVLVLDAAEVTLNVMVLAGLVVAIGVVVDDAIIDVENIVRRLREAPRPRHPALDIPGGAGRFGRGALSDHVRDPDQCHRRGPGALPERLVWIVLPAVGAVLRVGRAGVDGRGTHRDAGSVPVAAVPRKARRPRVAADAGDEEGLSHAAHAADQEASSGGGGSIGVVTGSRSRGSHSGQSIAAQFQGTRFLDALADPAWDFARGGDPDLGIGLS